MLALPALPPAHAETSSWFKETEVVKPPPAKPGKSVKLAPAQAISSSFKQDSAAAQAYAKTLVKPIGR